LSQYSCANGSYAIAIQSGKIMDIAKAVKKGKVIMTMIELKEIVAQWIECGLLDCLNSCLK
jgi:hypothetical protein